MSQSLKLSWEMTADLQITSLQLAPPQSLVTWSLLWQQPSDDFLIYLAYSWVEHCSVTNYFILSRCGDMTFIFRLESEKVLKLSRWANVFTKCV